jgi:hypothetical protein
VALKLIMAAMIATIASRAAAIELPPNFEEAAVVPGGPNGLAWPSRLRLSPRWFSHVVIDVTGYIAPP